MKARIPKNSNENSNENTDPSDTTIIYATTSNVKFTDLLQLIEDDFNKLYKKHGKENLLAIAKTLLSQKYLNGIGIPKHSLKHAKTKILSLLENAIAEIATMQYEERLESKKFLPLNILYSMTQPKYIQSIQKSNFSDELKQTAQKGIKKAVYTQAKKLGMSEEEFDLFVEDPKKYMASKKEKAKKDSSTPSAEKTFFDRVKGYTNGFKNFFVEPDIEFSDRPKEKFENYEQFLKFQTFKTKLKEYSIEHKMNELQVINKILSQKSQEFSEIDEDFIRILSERKKVILEQEKNSQEK